MHATTRAAWVGLVAPGGRSSATWPIASAVQHRAAPSPSRTNGSPPASPRMIRWSAMAARMASPADPAVAWSQHTRRSLLSSTTAAEPALGARLAGRPA
eukprot:9063385-Alexandrium_andersonii.AAC.1